MTVWNDLIEHLHHREERIERLQQDMPCNSDYLQGKADMCTEILQWMESRDADV